MEFLTFTPLWWLLVLPVLGAVFWASLADRSPFMKWSSFLLRIVAIVLIAIAYVPVFLSHTYGFDSPGFTLF